MDGAGELDQRVMFQRPRLVQNSHGEDVPNGEWDPIARVWAKHDPVSDGEQTSGARVDRLVTDRFTTMATQVLAALDLTEQLEHKGVVYDLVGRKFINRRRRIEWSAVARPGLRT